MFYRSLYVACKQTYCRMPGKWGLQQTHYPPEQTGQTNPLARLRWYLTKIQTLDQPICWSQIMSRWTPPPPPELLPGPRMPILLGQHAQHRPIIRSLLCPCTGKHDLPVNTGGQTVSQTLGLKIVFCRP